MKTTKTIPWVNTSQMIEIDRLMVDVFGIGLVQMMENAGRQLARLGVDRFLSGNPSGKKVAILAGSGGNGGGVLVAARNLHNWGADVQVFLTRSSEKLSRVTRTQAEILKQIGVQLNTRPEDSTSGFDLMLDGLLGYSLLGAPQGLARDLIRWANQQDCPVLSLDLPSGLDATSGKVYSTVIEAEATLTLALPKIGLRGVEEVGELYLADIGVPSRLYRELGLSVEDGQIFQGEGVIRLF